MEQTLKTVTPTSRMALSRLITGRVHKPMRLLVYGVDGVGKSTLAASAESPIFLGAEDGTSTLDVARFPEPKSWNEVFDALWELINTEHPYKTLAIDTLDWLEPLCWAHVVGTGKRNKDGSLIEGIEDFPYGKGYGAALDEWRLLCARLDELRAVRGMQIILIAHAWIKRFSNPEGDDFDRFEIKLHAKAQGLLREWSDAVLFAMHEQFTHKDKKSPGARAKGISTGARVLRTSRTAAFDAKNRYNLPDSLPLDWQALTDAITAGQPAAPETLEQGIAVMLDGADPALVERVQRAVAAAKGDASTLARIENRLAATLSIAGKETEQ